MIKKGFLPLIDRYLLGTATESEQLLVEEYLQRLEADGNATATMVQEDVKEAMWQHIQAQTIQEVPIIQIAWYKRKLARRLAIAASVICLLGLALYFYNNGKPAEQTVAQHSRKADSIPSPVRHIINTSGKDENIPLADGSLITLANNSEVTFMEPFTSKRSIALIGKAGFKVAKDKAKPFAVTSQAFSTTALGTNFTVTAFANAPLQTVRLYEGKVVVKAVNDKRMKKDFYLLPGQEFIYSNEALASVRNFNAKSTTNKETATDDLVGKATSLPDNASGSWHLFNNQSLGLVFNQLAELYDVKIVYSKQDVRRKYFVGRFNKTDSLDLILKYITTANRLTFSKQGNIYYINK
jgi:ferric-dicitrate binding protein FerR (iron transport regulator)